MLFKDVNFRDKISVLKSWRSKVYMETLGLLQKNGVKYISSNSLNRYITYLLEDTDYNYHDNVFYEPISRFKFTVDVFSQITFEYVMEHQKEFLLQMSRQGKYEV